MRDLQFDDAQTLSRSPDLHLQRPAPVPVVHLQLEQFRESHRAKRRKVREGISEEQTNESEHETVAQPGVGQDRAYVTAGPVADPENKIGVGPENGCGDALDVGGIVTPVRVDEHENVRRHVELREMPDPRQAGRTVSALWLIDDVRAVSSGDLGRPIRRAVVHDDDSADQLGNRAENQRERGFLVQGWKKNRYLMALGVVELTLLASLGWSPAADFPFPGLAIFAAAFATYAGAAWYIGSGPGDRRTIWLLAIAMRLALLPLTPELSDDVYRYLWDGHVQSSGVNPYAYAPAAAEVADLRTEYHQLVNNPTVQTIYPPLAQLAFLLIAMAGSTLMGAKIAWLICDLATAWLLGRIAAQSGRNERRVLLLYLWSPLLIVEVAWSGHLEPLGLFALTLSILLAGAARRKIAERRDDAEPSRALGSLGTTWPAFAAGGALALAALTKFAPAAALPALVRRLGWRPLAGFAITVLFLYAPYAVAGAELFSGLRTYSEHWWFMKGPFAALEALAADPTRARYVAAILVIAIVGWTAAARYDLERALLWTLGAGMVLTPTLHPWYVLWVLPMAALRTSRPWILLSGLAFIGYFGLGSFQAAGAWTQPGLARAVLWIPFLFVLAIDGWKLRTTSEPPQADQAG